MLLVLGAAMAVAFATAIAAARVMIMLAPRLRFLDRPGAEEHKRQTRAVPYGGGAAFLLAFAAGLGTTLVLADTDKLSLYTGATGPGQLGVIGAGVLALFAIGVVDDARAMRPAVKLALQGLVVSAVVWGADLYIDSLIGRPWLAYAVAWCWLMLITNAYNFIDHADGLSCSVALVSASVLLSGSLIGDDLALAAVWLALIAAIAGFLCWNLPPARIYLGDAGSLPLGFLIGAGTLTVTFWPSGESGSPLAVVSPLLITAVPLFDTAVVMLKRLRRRQPLLVGDRSHISHRLSRLGLSPRASLATIVALHLALSAGALQLRYQDLLPGVVVLAQCAGVLLAVILLETVRDDGH